MKMNGAETLKQLNFHIARIREEKNLTTRKLSKISSVGVRSIDRIQYEETANPEIRTLCKLADALEVPITDLFTYE
jgi:transcriptional regulator with XRE-family HTH domain